MPIEKDARAERVDQKTNLGRPVPVRRGFLLAQEPVRWPTSRRR